MVNAKRQAFHHHVQAAGRGQHHRVVVRDHVVHAREGDIALMRIVEEINALGLDEVINAVAGAQRAVTFRLTRIVCRIVTVKVADFAHGAVRQLAARTTHVVVGIRPLVHRVGITVADTERAG